MTAVIASAFPPALSDRGLGRGKSAVHRLVLVLVWLTIALSSIVFTEPAPVDALTIGLMILLPVVGLVEAKPGLWACFAMLSAMIAFGALSAMAARDAGLAISHMAVTAYLAGACILFSAFVAKHPEAHTRLILSAFLAAGIIAALCGICGYLNLFPGAYDLFTRYDRASGPFKDPNVFGPFLVAPLLTALDFWLRRPLRRGMLALVAAAILTVGILFSFSRGAWAAAAIGVGFYGYLYMLTAESNRSRLKLAALVLVGAALLGLIVAVALQSQSVARLLQERTALTQPYDEGPDGRFGGQMKAVGLIIENPLGLGAQNFARFFHHEEVHNVYLNMFLNTGWIGGILYLLMCGGTLALGFRFALRSSKSAPLFLIVFSALAGNICEGVLIDSDHWRHFYLLMALQWGLMFANPRKERTARAIRDRRPALLRSPLVVPLSRRQIRIRGRMIAKVNLSASWPDLAGKIPAPSARGRRIVAPMT
jgi:O-antigen ligase